MVPVSWLLAKALCIATTGREKAISLQRTPGDFARRRASAQVQQAGEVSEAARDGAAQLVVLQVSAQRHTRAETGALSCARPGTARNGRPAHIPFTLARSPRLLGMVPLSWFPLAVLRSATPGRENALTFSVACAGTTRNGGPAHTDCKLARFPKLLGMVPLSWFPIKPLRSATPRPGSERRCLQRTPGDCARRRACAQCLQAGQVFDAARDGAAQLVVVQDPAQRHRPREGRAFDSHKRAQGSDRSVQQP